MKDSKIVEVLKKLNKIQLNQLSLFVQSPFYNKRKELVLFMEFLESFYPEYSSDALNKKNAYLFIHPNKKYNEKEIGYYQSFLLKLIEEYLLIEELKDRDALRSSMLLKKLNELGLIKSFNSTLKNTKKHLRQSEFRNGIHFLDAYLIKRQENDFLYRYGLPNFDVSLVEAVNELNSFYFAEKLRYTCAMVNRNIRGEGRMDQMIVNEILTEIANENHKHEPVVQLYGSVLLGMLEPGDVEHYYNLKALLIKYIDYFPKNEVHDLFIYAINYCIRKISVFKQDNFFEEIFILFKLQLDNEILIHKGVIHNVEYANIVSTALELKEYDWVERFINQYRIKLPKSQRDSTYYYCLACLHFDLLDYDSAHKALNKVNFDDPYITLNAKTLLLKIFYELREMEALTSMAKTFKVFLRRNKKIGVKRAKLYTNAISILLKITKAHQGKRIDTKLIKEKIISEKVAIYKWLLKKVEEIEQKQGKIIKISRK